MMKIIIFNDIIVEMKTLNFLRNIFLNVLTAEFLIFV